MSTPDVDPLAGRYTWILVTGSIGAFAYGWGTGSNDVANAFGTSVGAKTLTLKQAVIMAAVFNFTGALVLGRISAETIAGGIAKADTFRSNAPVYAYGMSIVLWLGFLWQAFASYMSWNVSATHSIIGGIVGFAMVWGGTGSVFWAEPDSKRIPPIKGVVPIVLSWFVSPVLTGAASALFYGLTRYFVLKSANSTARSFQVLPIMIFFVVMIDIYFIFTRGAKKQLQSEADDWSDEKAFWISVVVGAGCAVMSYVLGVPFLRNKLKQKHEADKLEAENAKLANSDEKGIAGDMVQLKIVDSDTDISTIKTGLVHDQEANSGSAVMSGNVTHSEAANTSSAAATSSNLPQSQTYSISGSAFGAAAVEEEVMSGSAFGAAEEKVKEYTKEEHVDLQPQTTTAVPTWKERVLRGVEYDIHGKVEEDPIVAAIHANAEKWDEDTEYVFGYLQVISAICVIFAHGAGEVGYMAGPLAVIRDVVEHPGKNVVSHGGVVMPEIWTILIGAFGLLIGLATYGYKVCAAVGTQMAKITPSRGYAAELATSFVIMIAAQFGLPTSSSQCITGGIIGIALFEGAKGINVRLLSLTAMSWVWTIGVMGLGTAVIFSQGIYAPNRFQTLAFSDKLLSYQSLCFEHNYCLPGQYLKDCALVVNSAGRPEYRQGTCTNCSKYAADTCRPWQYLLGCTLSASGRCTNCTASNKAWTTENPMPRCPAGSYLTGCPGKCTDAK